MACKIFPLQLFHLMNSIYLQENKIICTYMRYQQNYLKKFIDFLPNFNLLNFHNAQIKLFIQPMIEFHYLTYKLIKSNTLNIRFQEIQNKCMFVEILYIYFRLKQFMEII